MSRGHRPGPRGRRIAARRIPAGSCIPMSMTSADSVKGPNMVSEGELRTNHTPHAGVSGRAAIAGERSVVVPWPPSTACGRIHAASGVREVRVADVVAPARCSRSSELPMVRTRSGSAYPSSSAHSMASTRSPGVWAEVSPAVWGEGLRRTPSSVFGGASDALGFLRASERAVERALDPAERTTVGGSGPALLRGR